MVKLVLFDRLKVALSYDVCHNFITSRTGGNFVRACVTERMRELHATFPATNAGNFVNIQKASKPE